MQFPHENSGLLFSFLARNLEKLKSTSVVFFIFLVNPEDTLKSLNNNKSAI